MSERYARLFELPRNLYTESSPIIIEAGALLKDTQTGSVLAQLKMRSLSEKTIRAVFVKISPLDTIGKPIGDSITHQYLDLNVTRDAEFGQKVPINLPNAYTREFTAVVYQVVYTDDDVWIASYTSWEPLPVQKSLESVLKDSELIKQYQISFGQSCKFQYNEFMDLWFCPCGEVNHIGERCHACKSSNEVFSNADLDSLKADCDARIERERQEAAEKRAAKKERVKKIRKYVLIITSIITILIMASLFTSKAIERSKTYNKGISLLESGKYAKQLAC